MGFLTVKSALARPEWAGKAPVAAAISSVDGGRRGWADVEIYYMQARFSLVPAAVM